MDTTKHRTLMPMFDELRGERVLVRPYRPEDAADLFAAVEESRASIGRWLPWVAQYESVDDSHDFVRRIMARWLLREDFTVGLWDAQTSRLLGGSGLHPRDWEIGSFEIGYWLRTSAEGHGYMTEAVRLLTDYAFDHLGANRVTIRCDARNERSAAVARRLGFVHEATLRSDSRSTDGAIRDTLVFALTPSDPRWPEPKR
jgi:RimJ/RimL family protein N-acetyltransferase